GVATYSLFFNDTPTTQTSTLSLHDALPISAPAGRRGGAAPRAARASPRTKRPREQSASSPLPCGRRALSRQAPRPRPGARAQPRSEEHTSELQSLAYLVCRLLLEKKKEQKK